MWGTSFRIRFVDSSKLKEVSLIVVYNIYVKNMSIQFPRVRFNGFSFSSLEISADFKNRYVEAVIIHNQETL